MHHVAVLDDVFLAFQAQLARIACAGLALERGVIGISDGLGADEALLEIRVDHAGGAGSLGALGDRPGAGFLRADGEVGDEAEQLVAGADHAVEAGLFKADGFEIVRLLAGRQNGDLALDLGRDDNGFRTLFLGPLEDLGRERVALVGGCLLYVAHVENRLGGEEAEHLEQALFFDLALHHAGGLALAQQGQGAVDEVEGFLGLLVVALGLLLERSDTLFEAVEVGQHQLGLDGLDIGNRVDLALDMGDVRVLEAAHHMGDGIDLADVGQELVAEAFTAGRAAHEAGDVHEGEARGDDLCRAGDACEPVEPVVRHRHVAHVRLDGAERVIRGLCRGRLRQGVEESGLADIRQADDAHFEAHGLTPYLWWPFLRAVSHPSSLSPPWRGGPCSENCRPRPWREGRRCPR